MVDWIGVALAILRATRKDKNRVDPSLIVIKPRALNDENLLRGVSVLQAVLAFIPPAAIASPILGLGKMGFNIWKRIALAADYDQLQYPPLDPNMLRLSIELDSELNKHYGQLVLAHNWNEEVVFELEEVYNDFQFLTDEKMLQVKYPHIDPQYVSIRASDNKHKLQTTLNEIEQEMLKVSHKPEINHNIRDAFDSLRKVFPAMQDWALFNSNGFSEIVDILDTIL